MFKSKLSFVALALLGLSAIATPANAQFAGGYCGSGIGGCAGVGIAPPPAYGYGSGYGRPGYGRGRQPQYNMGQVQRVPIPNPGANQPGAYRCTVGGQTGWCVRD